MKTKLKISKTKVKRFCRELLYCIIAGLVFDLVLIIMALVDFPVLF